MVSAAIVTPAPTNRARACRPRADPSAVSRSASGMLALDVLPSRSMLIKNRRTAHRISAPLLKDPCVRLMWYNPANLVGQPPALGNDLTDDCLQIRRSRNGTAHGRSSRIHGFRFSSPTGILNPGTERFARGKPLESALRMACLIAWPAGNGHAPSRRSHPRRGNRCPYLFVKKLRMHLHASDQVFVRDAGDDEALCHGQCVQPAEHAASGRRTVRPGCRACPENAGR